jgi:hypothetical protein
MNKTISVHKLPEDSGAYFVDGTANERVGLVWPLTVEAISLGKEKIREQVIESPPIRLPFIYQNSFFKQIYFIGE